MKKAARVVSTVVLAILVLWAMLTWYAERPGPAQYWQFGDPQSEKFVLIFFDPDPFYDLDKQVCHAIAEELATRGISSKVHTVASAPQENLSNTIGFVFCANTYNWAPDWATTRCIEKFGSLEQKPIIAVTLGAGSTGASQRKLEAVITGHEGKLVSSKSYWLMRPNDETRMEESNVDVALTLVRDWVGTWWTAMSTADRE